MASLQAFGQTGPRRDYVSFGPILMSYSGHGLSMARSGNRTARRGCQTAFPDYVAPSYGALAILAALHYRARTGKGQYIDISQAETAASMIGPAYLEYLVTGREPQPHGNFSATAAPHGCYRCKGDDRWCVIAIQSQDEWITLLRARRSSRVADRITDLPIRRRAWPIAQELDYWIGKWTAKYHAASGDDDAAARRASPPAVVQTAEDLYRDPHLRERGFAREVFHPQIGWVTRAGPSVRMTEHGFAPRGEAHVAGEDNDAVLGRDSRHVDAPKSAISPSGKCCVRRKFRVRDRERAVNRRPS